MGRGLQPAAEPGWPAGSLAQPGGLLRSFGRFLLDALSILATAVLVLVVKFSVRRRRPEGEWGAVYRKTDPHSFPSGHAARAVLLAVLALGTGPAWLGVLLAIWAPLVILARVAMGVHSLSDVIAGALFGALTGILILAVAPVV